MRKAYPPRRFATTTWHYLQDGVVFSITNAESIMEEHDYPGLRFTLIGTLDGLRQKVKIDISTGDAITPRAIEYRYPLMFEDRSLQIMSYNLETLLAEKLETIMYRGTSNTRMRDFYDIYMLTGKPGIAINDATLYPGTARQRRDDLQMSSYPYLHLQHLGHQYARLMDEYQA